MHYGRYASGLWPTKEGLNGVTRPKIKSIAVKTGKFEPLAVNRAKRS